MDSKDVRWYVIHVYSSYESVVKNNLEKMIENNGLQDYILEIAIPVEEDIVEKNGKRKVVERKKFPGYVFLKMTYTDQLWYMITNTRGVTGFVGPQGKALPLTAEEIKRMGLEKVSVEDFDMAVGDNVKVVSGALETFLGVVDEIYPDKQKVRVIVQMFGRQTPVELDFNQIEKI
ncbi:MAG: transcription termination/antitermination protein NusG [Clostridiales bacterium]|jgi:transcriptional antiterminator NusG|nr:transcription termination/antitermination protein NusG [Clostridiales bacterium]MDY4654779.1 transcription termination/antitermination protein NusG [Eubacteriales bacterium]